MTHVTMGEHIYCHSGSLTYNFTLKIKQKKNANVTELRVTKPSIIKYF